MKKTAFLVLMAAVLFFGTSADALEIKIAILAPEGTTWHKVMAAWNEELSQKTSGRVSIKIYAGGVLGDEKDVIRKMNIGQVHAAGFTGLGLGIINPEVRVLELPTLVSNYAEADALAKALQPRLKLGFDKKGFVLLGWAETGFVYIFSNSPIASPSDMDGKKMWAWEGDPLVEAMYREFKIVPIPLPLTDVRTSLQTHLIDAVYTPPLGAIALQWFTQTKYITDLKLSDSTGGILITKKAMQMISPKDQEILKETAEKYSKQLVERTRSENEKSYQTLLESGLTQVKVQDDERERITSTCRKVWDSLVGKLYSRELLNEAISAVESHRSSSK
ncbi:MAG TPA: TRAP transporter substrate-binding protein DctP [bacterium]|nr:TRAP transporter substrate-binding protein DctP [Myxococcales bacterium]HPW45773.1 TRAP transporter substrate-binding protein DctP [bacterium]HQC50356.1 TRAP transporter substrate-binding protein DctP [bacterium]